MNIFSVGAWDWGGSGYFLSQAVTKYTEHTSRALRKERSKLEFPMDMTGLTKEEIRRWWNWADVIHVHDALGIGKMKLPPKPIVVTYHGTKYRQNPERHNRKDERQNWMSTVATPDMLSFGLPVLQNCRPDLGRYINPAPEFTVVHAPTKRVSKGTAGVIKACEKLKVRLLLIENIPWKECIRLKGQGHVLIDQFRLGYGSNAIEAWSMGMPVISDAEEELIPYFEQQFDEIPFFRVEHDLTDAIEALRTDKELYKKYAELGHHHYCQYHKPEVVAQKAVGFYQQALDAFNERHGIAK